MAYQDIMVVLDDNPACEERLRLAARLASQHGAHLTGVMVIDYLYIPTYAKSQVPPELVSWRRQVEDESRARVHEQFERVAEAEGVPAQWHTVRGVAAQVLADFSRYADLTVVGQYDPEAEGLGVSPDLAEHVVLGSGRPVLTVPYAGSFPTVGQRVMVAWDGSREAARAMADALPLLRGADKVITLSAVPKRRPQRKRAPDEEMPDLDIARHLARHEVTVEAQRIDVGDVSISDTLLNRISDESIDLLVMGAYGHTRAREIWLGGVTRDLMRHMTVPVLASH